MGFLSDIVTSVASSVCIYHANGAFDKLIEEIREKYGDSIADEEYLYEEYIRLKDEYTEKRGSLSPEDDDFLMNETYDAKVVYLETLAKNNSIPEDYRTRIKEAIDEFRPAFAVVMDQDKEEGNM